MPETATKAMILAAGLGTRLKPFTEKHPKALAPVSGKPLLQHNIEYLKSFGIREIIINVHHFADQIIDFLHLHNDFGLSITLSHEDEPLETGGGLKKAEWFFKNETHPFFLMNVDVLTNLDLHKMRQAHLDNNPIATLAVTNRNTSRYFLFDKENTLCGWKNFKTGETRLCRNPGPEPIPGAFTCVHLLDPVIFSLIDQTGKFSIIDTYLELGQVNLIKGYWHSEDIIVDVGKPDSIKEAEKYF